MNTLKHFGFVLLLFSVAITSAQNPYKSLGVKDVQVLTLSGGKYDESFDEDSIVQIGTVLFNTNTGKIVAFVHEDTMRSEATMKPEIVSKWLSPDPLAAKSPFSSPYVFANNNPILFVDPDGRKTTYYMYNQDTKTYVVVFKSKDNLPNGITIVNPQNNEQFMDALTATQGATKKYNDAFFNKNLRQQGTTYLTDDMDRLNKYKDRDNNSGFYDVKTQEPKPLKNEHYNYMVPDEEPNTVRVGDKSNDGTGDATTVVFENAPSNTLSKIHSHPEAGTKVSVHTAAGQGNLVFEGTPSPWADDNHKAAPGYYNVITSPQGVCLYNYEPQQGEERRPNLVIPKSEVPK